MPEITVTIKSISETKSFGEKGFRKRDLIGIDNSNSQYPQVLKFELQQDNCSILDTYSEGQEVELSLNINGREWTNPKGEVVVFNSLVVWRIKPVAASGGGGEVIPNDHQPNEEDIQELPFLITILLTSILTLV